MRLASLRRTAAARLSALLLPLAMPTSSLLAQRAPRAGRAMARAAARPATTPFTVTEAGIPALQAALTSGQVTSVQLVQQYLTRIALYEDRLNAIITVNPAVLADAAAMDDERRAGRLRGPLHGIPVALKDNILTKGLRTTGGALAFSDLVPSYDATLVANLRKAGAIIIAKTQLTELANWMATGMPGNYTGVHGYSMNPWDPRRDPRDGFDDGRPVLGTGGSSSGVGTNVSFWAGNVGTETSGSVLSPSQQNFLVGIKPTIGRISRYGVIPITADQDTPGPMTRSVTDAAIMLGALEGTQPDPNDAATTACTPPTGGDYTPFLRADGLAGKRIGIPRAFFYDRVASGSSTTPRGGLPDVQQAAMRDVIAVLKAQGAVIVDPADIPSVLAPKAGDNFLDWNMCSGLDQMKGRDAECSIAFKYGMKRDFNTFLKTLGAQAPVKSLTELRLWNIAHQRGGAMKYGQALLDGADEMDVVADRARYEADRRKDILLSATQGIDAVMASQKLDALLFPGVSSANIAARTGYPSVTVPWALLPVVNPPSAPAFPAGFTPAPAPFNVTFTAGKCAEPTLITLAYAFEQATKKRVAPPQFP
ncbi:MAG: amidase family protein [Gemmatimonadaceae bacterium]